MTIHGSKKGSSKPRQPIIAPDSAQSKTYINILYGLGEGEIAGLADGYKSVYLDDTPLQNDNGEFNFPNIKVDFRSGTNDQTYIDGFPDVSSETAVNVELKHGTPFVKAFNNLDLDALRIRLKWGALRSQNADNGDVGGVKIDYAIDIKTDNGGWVQSLTTSINAKTSNNYERSHRIDLPTATQGWQVRVRRITPNSTSDFVSDKMYVSAITEVIDLKLRYPNTALLGLRYDAESFNNVAKMSARCRGLIIKVPTNYDPETRTYTGLWDGTFKRAYTNNPAWVYYDLCTAERYGLGGRLTESMIDKWSLYRLAQYCDEMVDDGMGGQEPRFTVNVYIQSAEGAFDILSKLAGVFRAISYWDGNSIVVDADIPQDSMYSFSRANVIDGVFEYSGTRARDRHTVAKVAWSNPANHFKTEYEYVRDEKAIAKFGVRVADISAWGCTSKGQAQRAGLWALKSEQLETRMVTFKVGLDGYIPTPAKVIEISDELFAGRANGGRVLAINKAKTIITLDRPITAKAGDTLVINGDDGVSQRRQISAINGDKVTVTKSFGDIGVENVWVLDSADLATMKFRVLSVTADDNHQFTITAVQYNPTKYDAIDTGAYIDERPISVINPTVQASTKSVSLSSYTQVNQGVNVTTLVISWEQVTGAVKYAVEWRKDNGNWQALPPTGTNSIEISGVYAGQYEARVTAISAFGQASLATHSNLTEIQGKTGRPPKIARLSVKGGLFSMELGWVFNRGSDDTNFTEIQVSPDGRSNITTLGTFAYPTNKHEITGLQGNLTQFYRARIVDKLGNTSDWTAWVSGTTSAQADKVLDLISGQISQSHLDQSLRMPIAKIGGIESGLNGIKTQIPSLQSTVNSIKGQLPTLNTKIATAERNLQTAQSTLNTAVANITTERNRISSAIRDITALQSANNAKTQEIANLVQTVGNHTSSIRELGVTTGELAQKYSQIKTQADKSTSDITEIKQTQAGQATSIDRLGVRFDSLAVGGRNYLLNSDFVMSKNDGGNLRSPSLQLSPNINNVPTPTTFIISAHFKLINPTQFANDTRMLLLVRFRHADNSITAKQISYNAKSGTPVDKRLSVQVSVDKPIVGFGHTYIDVYGITADEASISQPKLEIGTIATDWTPAPEDTSVAIGAVQASVDEFKSAQATKEQATASRITELDTAYKQADTQANAKIDSEITARTTADTALSQRIDSLQSEFNGNKSSIASQLKTLTDKDKSTASQISQITANVTTVQQIANTANSKADTANTKADDGIRRANNAQNTANTASHKADTAKRVADDALGKATQAKADIIAEQQARADGDGSLARQMSALDSKFTTADNAIKASVAQAQQTATNAQQAVAVAQSQMNARFDSLAVGGRNYLLNSNTSRNSHGTTYLQVSPSLDVSKLRQFVLSCDVSYTNAHRATTQGAKWFRIGLELTCTYTDGSRKWFGVWKHSINNSDSFDGRISALCTIPSDKILARIDSAIIQIWDIVADTMIVKNPKLELGNIATDWMPAPEDVQSRLDSKANTATLDEFKQAQASKDQATATKLSQIETAYKSADNNLTAKIASETTARTTADTALSQRIDSLQSEFNGNKSAIASQLKTLSDKDKATASQISQITANVTTAQRTANTANSKADTATTKADNAQSTANNALTQATSANSAITAEQRARADADSSLASRITALDGAYKKADTDMTARLAREEIARANADNANAQAVSNLQSTVNGISGRVGTAESKIGTLERTTSDTNQALAMAQSQMNARFDGLSVGGRNLLLNTQDLNPLWLHPTKVEQGVATLEGVGGRLVSLVHPNSDNIQALENGKITISFTAKSNQNGRLHIRLRRYNSNTQLSDIAQYITIDSRKFKRYSLVLDYIKWTDQERVNFEIATYEATGFVCEVKLPKLEIGTIPTDYTPAPEDVQADIDTAINTANTQAKQAVQVVQSNLDEYKQAQATKEQATAQRIAALDTAYKLADTTLTARLAHEEQTRTSANAALTQRLDSLQSTVNGNKASIDNQLHTLSEKDKAQAQKLSQLESSLGQKASAAALNNLTTKVSQVEGRLTAEASKYSTLQTTVGQHTASIQMVMQSVDGLKSQWTMKVESGGVVAGIGLASSNGKSRFAIRADVLDVVSPDGTKRPMFSVLTRPQTINGVLVQKGSYFDTAFIAHGSINMLHIADSIQSDNYVAGRSGWRLFKNGTIEINSTFGDGTKIQLTSRGLVGFYANGRRAFELGHFV